MTKKIVFSLIFILEIAGWGCQNAIQPPMDKEKLTTVLVDLHVADALAERENSAVKDSVAKIYYKQIFDKHGIDKATLDTTLALIGREPADLDSLYNQVTRRIQALKQ